jgi:hypothetical protein
MLGVKIMEASQEEARVTSSANLKQNAFLEEYTDGANLQHRQNVQNGRSAEKAAAVTKTSARTIHQAAIVSKQGDPSLIAAVRADQVAMHNAVELAKLPAEEQRTVVGLGPEAMLERAQLLRQEKPEKQPATPRTSTPIGAKGIPAIRDYFDKLIEKWAKITEPTVKTEDVFAEFQMMRMDLCGARNDLCKEP